VGIGRGIAKLALLAAIAADWGCAHGPRNFQKVDSPVPLVRARAVGLGRRRDDAKVIPALVNRLDDQDPVVRLAAYEELRQRTGQDFGYVPWASPEERAGAVGRWRAWIGQSPAMAGSPRPTATPQSPGKLLPTVSATAPLN
jgi:HEAT repeats